MVSERKTGGLPKGMYRRPSGTYYGAFVDQQGRRVRRALGRDKSRAITAFYQYRGAGAAPTPARILPTRTTPSCAKTRPTGYAAFL